jgi:hypothetical protein
VRILFVLLLLPGRIVAADLEQVISHENPLFKPREAHLTVGRDGRVYLAGVGLAGGHPSGFVLRMSREGADKYGAEMLPCWNATANRDGVMAIASPGYGRQIALYDVSFVRRGRVDDFEDPAHVEAGTSGDFYGLDNRRVQILRVGADGKHVKTYRLPESSPREKHKRSYTDLRVCEKTGAFYLVVHDAPARIVCVGFDGKDRWIYEGRVHYGPVGVHRWAAAFDVDENGILYVLDGETIRKIGPDGKPAGEVKLRMGDASPALGGPGYGYLRVFRNEVLLKRFHDSELFRRYDLLSGDLKAVVSAEHERVTASFGESVWTAGRSVPIRIKLTAGERALSPQWRVWARPVASLGYREFPIKDGAVQVPGDCAGFYLVKITPELQPWQHLSPSDYLVRTVVEIRQPDAKGSATVLTPDNRSHYGRGEKIPFVVTVQGAQADRLTVFTVRLLEGKQVLAQAEGKLKGNSEASFKVPATLTGALRPGNYMLAVNAPGLTCTGQPLVIGPGMTKPSFHVVGYADYGLLYPGGARRGEVPEIWDAPDLTAAHAARTAKLGQNMVVERLGWQIDLTNHLAWSAGDRAELDALRKRLQSSSVPPQKVSMAPPLLQTQAAYSAAGIQQMAVLTSMDAGLPLGTGFDRRTPEEFERDITRVTRALLPYPCFRGWSWSNNRWIGEKTGSKAARTAEESSAYEAALKRAKDSGAWDPVLDKVSGYRLRYAVEAQEFFNATLEKLAPGKVTAVAGPYRSVDVYPPVTFSNVDEVDLHYQAEQLQWPNVAPHSVDYEKRPGKRAWGHPELHNDAGTGDQILPALFQMVMRGADGVGCSGSTPNWGPQPEDARSAYQGTTSVHRAAYRLLREYGPWLTTLRNKDRIAIVVSGRMCRIDEWGAIGGRYFDRLFEAYQSCLRAHYPASYVFADDLSPDALKRFKAVLVVGQTVGLEPDLADALRRARAAGTAIFCDGTCRPELVKEFETLGTAFDRVTKDKSPWQDDTAYLRFARYYQEHLPALEKAFGAVLPPVAGVDNPDVLLSERAAGEGRYLFVVNDTPPDLDPGQLWRVTLAIATRVPMAIRVKLEGPHAAVYDVFALKQVTPRDGVVEADLRSLPARLYAILPAPIAAVALRGPKRVKAGQAFAWSAEVQDRDGQPISASIPVRVRLLAGDQVLEEQFTAASGSNGASGNLQAMLNAAEALTLEVTELFSGRTARLPITVQSRTGPVSLNAAESPPDAAADTAARGDGHGKDVTAAEERFGPHLRDLVLTDGGTLAVASAMNWDHNLYAVDVKTGELRWRQRAGHYFTFAPQALSSGLAVQGYDLKSAEGYHLYLVGNDGKLERRFALYGLPNITALP